MRIYLFINCNKKSTINNKRLCNKTTPSEIHVHSKGKGGKGG